VLGVTGATGNIGGRVARLLAAADVEQRLVCRTPAKAPTLPGATLAQASYGDRAAAVRALDGVDTLLMVSGSEAPDRLEQHRTFVDAAGQAGVGHLVYTSFYGAAPDATFTLARDHDATEQHIREVGERQGMSWTFLRDNMYLDFLPLLADEDGTIRGPAGDGQVAAVAQGDVAACALAVLLDPAAHVDRTYSLTGPAALTMAEVADELTRSTGRRVAFVDETVEEAYASRASYGAPDWQLDAWVSTYTAIRAGELAAVTGDVRRLTGRDPLSLADLLSRS
jgi:uncharacterized protein YbjT (DUF2867 family)